MSHKAKARILIVSIDQDFSHQIAETLSAIGDYITVCASSFEEALSEILLNRFVLVVTEVELSDLSGMDLLAAAGALRPGIRVMILDDDATGKTALAALRLGACDYIRKPVSLQFLLMEIEQQVLLSQAMHPDKVPEDKPVLGPPPASESPLPVPAEKTPSRTRILRRKEFAQLNYLLQTLHSQLNASFVGLIDVNGNMLAASGSPEGTDLLVITRALTASRNEMSELAVVLDEELFHSTYLEGQHTGIYIVKIPDQDISLAIICPKGNVKPGTVWLYSRRVVETVNEILATTPAARSISIGG